MRKRKRLAVGMAAALACAVMVTGFPADMSGGSRVQAEETEKTYKIGMSIDTTSQAWRAGLVEDVSKEAALHPEVELTITDANGNTEKQISDVEDLITKGVQAILISPIETQPLTNVCKKAYDQGIHVIVLDRELEGEDWTCFIGANNRNIGAAAGELDRKSVV